MTKSQFRWLVTASIAAAIAGVIVSFAGEASLPPPLREYVASQYEGDVTAMELALVAAALPLLIAAVVSIIGLYRFWRFARPLTVIVWVLGFVFQALAGPVVEWGLAASLYELSAVLSGMIIAVIYLPPVKEWFEGQRED